VSAGAAWERVVRAALLGTERQAAPADASTGDPVLDGAVAALADRPAEARLLGTAVLLDAWRRAGQRPGRMAVAPAEQAPEGEERICSPLAARVLRQLLAGSPAALADWMGLAQRTGVTVPHELLPEVLDYTARHPDVRGDVARALGPRGQWLAARNPAWTFGAGLREEPAEGWDTGTAAERVRILRHVRASDPAAGLALLQTTWTTDAPRDRAAFVEALAVGLGMDDEPFLEATLDDKRKEVREAAAAQLSALPDSRLVRRMTDRLLPLLTLHVQDGLVARIKGDRVRMAVQLPAECDKGMKRDGIEPKPGYGFGERTWWLHQMIAAVPPAFWTAHWGRSAADLLAGAQASQDGDTLVAAWTDAAVRVRDAEWAEARLRMESKTRIGTLEPIASILPAERLEPLILEQLPAGNRFNPSGPVGQLLQAARFPWSPALTRAVLSRIPAEFTPSDYGLRELLRASAPYMHPATAVATLREQGDPHEDKWVDLLHLRNTLHQAFQ
jgi:hypothetical protein